MNHSSDGHIITGRRPQKLRDRARRARRDGKAVVLLTVRDRCGGPVSVLFVAEPGQPAPAFAYFPQATEDPK